MINLIDTIEQVRVIVVAIVCEKYNKNYDFFLGSPKQNHRRNWNHSHPINFIPENERKGLKYTQMHTAAKLFPNNVFTYFEGNW